LFNWITTGRQKYKSAFGSLLALLLLISNIPSFLPQNGFASSLFEEESAEGSTEEAPTPNKEICDNIMDDDGDGLTDNQDVVDCPGQSSPIPTPTPEAAPEEEAAQEEGPTPTPEAEPEEEAASEEEQADEESETEICDNNVDDDGDGLVDTEDSEDCPEPEEEAAQEEGPTPTPEAEPEEEAA
jgi:hypothetical protein